ncbi:uncharacterized protein [Arachis hypogaea]|uniref:uncharacterized protein n=1 Tax=Arachis hypogaea TaxID=3818 RepID=UPI003B223872
MSAESSSSRNMVEYCPDGYIEFDSRSVQHEGELQVICSSWNPAALLRMGMAHLFLFGHRRGGIQTLAKAAELGDVEACYISLMLLLSLGDKDEDEIRLGFEFFGVVREFGVVKRCREVFTQVFAGPWLEIPPADPEELMSCRFGSCRTRETMDDASDLSSVSCVQCLAEYEVRKFLGTVYV